MTSIMSRPQCVHSSENKMAAIAEYCFRASCIYKDLALVYTTWHWHWTCLLPVRNQLFIMLITQCTDTYMYITGQQRINSFFPGIFEFLFRSADIGCHFLRVFSYIVICGPIQYKDELQLAEYHVSLLSAVAFQKENWVTNDTWFKKYS